MVSIFGKGRSEAQAPRELVELDWGHHDGGPGSLSLRIIGIEEFQDVDNVLDALREKQNIVVMKIRPGLASDKTEVRRASSPIPRTRPMENP